MTWDCIYQRILPSSLCVQYKSLSSFTLHIFPGFRVSPTFSRNTNPQHGKAQMPGMEPVEVVKLSKTALRVCCKICGEPEEEYKRFLICGHSLCMYKYYHIRCLTSKQIASRTQRCRPRWYCPSCLCRVCLSDKDDDQIILCDGCDEGHHLYCLNPPHTSVPVGEWYCPSCIAEKAKEKELRAYEQRMLKLHRKDHAILKKAKYYGVDMLLDAAEMLSKDEQMVNLKE